MQQLKVHAKKAVSKCNAQRGLLQSEDLRLTCLVHILCCATRRLSNQLIPGCLKEVQGSFVCIVIPVAT